MENEITIAQYFLYGAWFALPACFFLMGFWSMLEVWSGKDKKENPGDIFKQGTFLLICSGLSLVIDRNLLPWLSASLPSWTPPMLLSVLLLPVVLYLTALLIGPTRVIRIQKPSHPSQRGTRIRKC